jgi:gliding motility-associated-like protein
LNTNVLTYIFKNKNGCDSVVIVSLKHVKKDTSYLPVLTTCNPNDSATQIRFFKNINGCDSTVIQRFKLLKSDTVYIDTVSCNPIDTGIYIKKYTNIEGCDSTIIRRVKLLKNDISAVLSIDKNLTCYGDRTGVFSIKNIEGGLAPYFVLWSDGDKKQKRQDMRAGTYSVMITDAQGCSINKSIELKSPPPLSCEVEIISPRCFGESSGSFKVHTIKNGKAPYRYTFNNLTFELVKMPHFEENLPAKTYLFTIKDSLGCSVSKEIILTLPEKHIIIFSDNNISLKIGDSIQLSPQLNFKAKNCLWAPPQYLQCDTCLTTWAYPQKTTPYKLTAFDENGCIVTANIQLKVDETRNVYIPNTISPNGDGVNDKFTVFSDATVSEVKLLEIFNRWGTKIYELRNFKTNDNDIGWDGTYNNKVLDDNVFVYYCIVVFKDGKEALYKGEITLMR